mgnify:CR=1 FL=1
MSPVLDIKNLSKNFGSIEILKNINISIDEGDFLVLVGPSGCGKSTLLNCIAGLEPISDGGIAISGQDMTHVSPKDRNIAMVFQSYALYPTMTVAKNITFGMKVRGVEKEVQAQKLQEVSRQLQIEPLLNRRPGQLSGGQRQRVAMGRALVRDPKLFLFDEPLSNLDAKLRVEMRTEIKKLHQSLGASMVYVTHDQIEAMTLADRVVVMKEGVVQQVGSPTEIYDRPANAFVASFIGNPAMNLIEGLVSNGVFSAEHTQIEVGEVPDGPVTLGFRAEDAQVVEVDGNITAPIYTQELLGDATMVSVRLSGALVAVKADKNYRAAIEDEVSFRIPSELCHLFDSQTGARIGG